MSLEDSMPSRVTVPGSSFFPPSVSVRASGQEMVPVAQNPVQTATQLSLDALVAIFDRWIAFPTPRARDAVVLWAAHTHVYRVFDATPRLSLRSKEPGSGKSRVLDVLREVVPDALDVVCTTPAVLWRSLAEGSPTILLDEADTVFGVAGSSGTQKALRSIIDAGHRRGAVVPRLQGGAIQRFDVYAPVALAGLGRLPATIASRSVEIMMSRPRTPVTPFRFRTAKPYLDMTKRLLVAWAGSARDTLELAEPELPVTDRDADVWEPLVAIADLAGPEWGDRAREACVELTRRSSTSQEGILTAAMDDVRNNIIERGVTG